MSDLLIILVALGVLIVLGVLLFNWRQERQYQDRVSENFKPTQRDVLIEDFHINADLLKGEENQATKEKIEPSLSDDRYTPEPTTASADTIDFNDTQSTSELASQANTATNTNAISAPELSLADEQPPSKIDEVSSFGDTMTLDVASFGDKANTPQELIEEPAVTEPETSEMQLPEAVHLQTDLIGILYANDSLTAEQVAALNDFNAVTHHFAYGQTESGDWQALSTSADVNFNKLLYAMQMADRGGPVAREIIHAFQQKIESIGTALGAQVEWQNKADPVAESIELDRFCIDVDKTIGFHIVANNAQFHGTKFRGLVEAQGLQLKDDGRYVMASNTGEENFYVKNYEGKQFSNEMLKTAVMSGVTFQLDLPTVANSSEVFDTMIACAKTITSSLDADIVDDKRKPIGDIQFEKIRAQLNIINAQMIAKGIIPGSTHALRLFS